MESGLIADKSDYYKVYYYCIGIANNIILPLSRLSNGRI